MLLKFSKMHGLGNDFVLLDAMETPLPLSPDQRRRLADRRFGIGCDQLLILEPPQGAGSSARLRIYNTDGSEAAQCGNGVRCAADFLRRHRAVQDSPIVLEIPGGSVQVYGAEGGYRVNMGAPQLEPARIPLDMPSLQPIYRLQLPEGEVEFAALAVGNPHAILVVPDVDAAPVAAIGAAIQSSGAFPAGVNVEFMQVLDPGHVRVRVFERGVGETLACGSGACAAAIAGILNNGLDSDVDVGLKGGHLQVRWTGPGEPVWMTGPAAAVFDGRIDL